LFLSASIAVPAVRTAESGDYVGAFTRNASKAIYGQRNSMRANSANCARSSIQSP
jgi:hypothetical protein